MVVLLNHCLENKHIRDKAWIFDDITTTSKATEMKPS